MLVLAIILFLLDWLLQKIRRQSSRGILLRWLLLLPVGATGIYLFVMHLFFPVESAAIMKWPVSPFQVEVGLANLCIGLLGICSFRASYGFRLATVIVAVFWMWGHAVYEIYHIITTSNIYLGDAVSWFWVDFILPFALITCLKRSQIIVVETITTVQPIQQIG
jgi:hypothetical protein